MDNDEIDIEKLLEDYDHLISKGEPKGYSSGFGGPGSIDEDYTVSEYELWQLIEQIGTPAINIATQYFQNKDPLVRKRSITMIGGVGEPSLPLIQRALRDQDSNVRRQSVLELGRTGLPAINDYKVALNDEDLHVRENAIWGLGRLGKPALEVLGLAINDSHGKLRKVAIKELGKLGEPAIGILIQAINDEESDVRLLAIQQLGNIGEPALEALTQALNDTDVDVRKQAIKKLGGIGEPALETLTQAYEDDDPEIRYEVIRNIPSIDASIGLITKAIDDPIPEIGREAVNSATAIGLTAIRPVILATETSSGKVSNWAMVALIEYKEYSRIWTNFNDRYFPVEILDSIVSIIIDDLVIRRSGRSADLFNSKVIKNIFEVLIPQNPSLRTRIFSELCSIAYEYQDGPQQRAVAVARNLGHEEFASEVKKRSSENPKVAALIMRELGGSEATAYFTEAQSQTLAEYRAPLIDLEEMARQRWEELTLEAKQSSATSKWMSIGVFVVGTSIVVWAFILLSLSNEPWQQLAAALAGVGSFLALYSQRFWKEPVEQIQRFSSQQARLQIAFIGFMNRVAQIRLVFEDAYAKDELPPETMAMYQQWLNEATDKAWQQLSDAASTVPSTTPNNEG